MVRRLVSATSLCVAAAVLCSTLGCGGGTSKPKTNPVSGKLTKGGMPLPDIYVTFAPKATKGNFPTALGKTDADGRYTLKTTYGDDGAVEGAYSVVLSSAKSSGPPPAGADPEALFKQHAEAQAELPFPKEYASETTTPKYVDVKKGPNTIDIAIP